MIPYTSHSASHIMHWHIKRFPVYRILDNEQWMDNFFETGEIQLSCFSKFRNYEDEMQGDFHEGKGRIVFPGDESTHYLEYEAGLNAFILSTTKTLNAKVVADFKGKCAIKINYPTPFAMEIAKKLPYIETGVEGSCDYVKDRLQFLERQFGTENLVHALRNKENQQVKQMLSDLTQGMELFAKHEKYSHQEEYRFVWFSKATISSTVIIRCPEAIEYCQKVLIK